MVVFPLVMLTVPLQVVVMLAGLLVSTVRPVGRVSAILILWRVKLLTLVMVRVRVELVLIANWLGAKPLASSPRHRCGG